MGKAKKGGPQKTDKIDSKNLRKLSTQEYEHFRFIKQRAEEQGNLLEICQQYPEIIGLDYLDIYEVDDEHQQPLGSAKLFSKSFPYSALQSLIFIKRSNQFNKIYGNFIVNENFEFLYADNLSKEMLQSAFYSLSNHSLLDFVVAQDRLEFAKRCNKSMIEKYWVEYIIYSKMVVRKYQNYAELENPSNTDYFFRFLKSLVSRVTAATIDFSNWKNYQGQFWCKDQLEKQGAIKCFVFTTKWNPEIPNLDNYDFSADERIKKFKKNIETKRTRKNVGEIIKISQKMEQYLQSDDEQVDSWKFNGDQTFNNSSGQSENQTWSRKSSLTQENRSQKTIHSDKPISRTIKLEQNACKKKRKKISKERDLKIQENRNKRQKRNLLKHRKHKKIPNGQMSIISHLFHESHLFGYPRYCEDSLDLPSSFQTESFLQQQGIPLKINDKLHQHLQIMFEIQQDLDKLSTFEQADMEINEQVRQKQKFFNINDQSDDNNGGMYPEIVVNGSDDDDFNEFLR